MDDTLDIQQEEHEEPSSPFWMTTYSDMVTLLLTFFVLIVSMSEVEQQRFMEALSHFNGRRSVLLNDASTPAARPNETREIYLQREEALDQLSRYLRDNDLEEKIKVTVTEDGIHVSIADSVVFSSGQAELLASSRSILAKVSDALTPLAATVTVEGHTDNRPIRTAQFPSNWELSGARAASVVRFFLEQRGALPAAHYKTVGHGEFHPVAGNNTAAGRARNRRVEILFSHAEGD